MSELRMVFMGTADLAATVLARLADVFPGCVAGVVSQPDRPKGRDLQLEITPVKIEAQRRGLPVWQPERARSPEALAQLRDLAPDLIVVAAYGQLLPPALLEIPRYGCLNVHTSLLPRWRGAAPIQWAIAAGDAVTGVTLMRMEAGLDTGPIVATCRTAITDEDTGQTLHDRLAGMGAELLVASLPEFLAGRLPPKPQPETGVTLARKIVKDDGRLDWGLDARELWRRLRAFTPWPGAFTFFPTTPRARLLKIHTAVPVELSGGRAGEIVRADREGLVVACGRGGLRLLEVQLEGGRRLPVAQFLAGQREVVGLILGPV